MKFQFRRFLSVRHQNVPPSALGSFLLAAVVPLVAGAVDVANLPPPASRAVDFVRDVQPILARSCYGCHGPDKQKSELRWDVKSIALKGGEHGPVILPGNSAESPVIHFVSGLKGENSVMPAKGERLTPEQIGLLRAWIDQGANWPDSASTKITDPRDHWAFKSPVRPPVPAIPAMRDTASALRNPIDAFIRARLDKEGLKPSPEADRVTLLRRLSLDLTGLPPTIAEVDDFLADKSPAAYEKVVERLLASPHYGERWGRHWLDAARYADSNGFEKDARRSIWPYRDYVINALNRDLPFDQFTVEQLAGDLLPNPTLDQRVATGFLRNSMMNQEGGIEPEQFRIDAMIDRMDAIGKTWLGLTIACAQCHNHKYDPIASKDYYSIFAFINSDDEPSIEVPTADQLKQREEILEIVRTIEKRALLETTNLTERMATWENGIAAAATTNWMVLEPKEWMNFATKFEKQPDMSLLGGGDVKPGGLMHVWADTTLTNITGFRLEVLTHPNLPYGGPGQVAKGNFLLKEFTAEAYALNHPSVTNQIKFRRALASASAPGFGITNAIDGNTKTNGWSCEFGPLDRNKDRVAVFECETPIEGFPGGTRLHIALHEMHSNGDGHSGASDKDSKLDCHMIGRFRLSATTEAAPLKIDPLSPAQRELLAVGPDERTSGQKLELFRAFRLFDPSFEAVNREILNSLTNWPYAPTTLALQKRADPRVTRVFKRGDWQRQTDVVQPDVPPVLHPFPEGAPRNRMGFAKWLVARRSPTTARVFVNRVWQDYFGAGLFTTPEDIGTRVDTPSHPELLDWLAVEFMEPSASLNHSTPQPWSLKQLHRTIVTSATYRQSSIARPELLDKDPYNRLLARGPRFRVEGEIVQDIALAVSGLLNPKIGGPSVYPPIPASVSDTVYGGFSWPESKGEERYRRGMYTFWKRALPFPPMLSFDTPAAESSCPRRTRSNTPLQALTTLNERTFVEASKAMALRVIKEGGNDNSSRAAFAFRLCTGRQPTEKELNALLRFWDEQFTYFEDRTAAAVAVAAIDAAQPPQDVNLHKAAAWTMVSRTILNLDETFTKE